MYGSEPIDSAWCLSALCFGVKLSPKLNTEADYERVKWFFQLYFTQDTWLKEFQGTEGRQLQNNLKLNTEFLENSTLVFCCDQLA